MRIGSAHMPHATPVSSNDVPIPDDELVPFDPRLVDTENLFEPDAEFSPDPAAPETHTHPSLPTPPSQTSRTLLPFEFLPTTCE